MVIGFLIGAVGSYFLVKYALKFLGRHMVNKYPNSKRKDGWQRLAEYSWGKS